MVPTLDEGEEVSMEIRDASPADYLLKIENFSKLLEAGNEKFESKEFESGGYKWKLILYPKGRTSGDGDDYLSVYLELADPVSLPAGSEINAIFSFFLYNQICDNYLSIRGRTRRFHVAKIEWGINKLISTKALTEPSNGYIVDDNVVFGAEVHVITKKPITQCLSMLKINETFSREWKFSESSLYEALWTSEEFTAGNLRWRIKVYPKGSSPGNSKSISAYLETADSEFFKVHEKVKVDFTIYIKDHRSEARLHAKSACDWFSSGTSRRGWHHFMPLADVDRKAGCFVLNGCWVFGIEISVPCAVGRNLN